MKIQILFYFSSFYHPSFSYHLARSISEEFSSGDAARFRDDDYVSKTESGSGSTHTKSDSAHKSDKDKDKKDKEKEDKDEETIKVFDGNCSLRRKIFRAITVSRTCSLDQLLTIALRAFHITRDSSVSFYLQFIQFIRYSTN